MLPASVMTSLMADCQFVSALLTSHLILLLFFIVYWASPLGAPLSPQAQGGIYSDIQLEESKSVTSKISSSSEFPWLMSKNKVIIFTSLNHIPSGFLFLSVELASLDWWTSAVTNVSSPFTALSILNLALPLGPHSHHQFWAFFLNI